MKAPSKGEYYELMGYDRVRVKGGPSPDHPYVFIEHGPIDNPRIGEMHIDEFKERRIS